jgi:hypothetical protein
LNLRPKEEKFIQICLAVSKTLIIRNLKEKCTCSDNFHKIISKLFKVSCMHRLFFTVLLGTMNRGFSVLNITFITTLHVKQLFVTMVA